MPIQSIEDYFTMNIHYKTITLGCIWFVFIGTMSSLAGFVLILVTYLAKINRKEKFLLAEFGEDYRDYMERSWVLVPYIY